MKPINKLTQENLSQVEVLVFDCDGVLVPRGTKIEQKGSWTKMRTKHIPKKLIQQITKLNKLGFYINITSGRGLYMLQDMFRSILPFVSLTYENGSATWHNGKVYQHVNSFKYLKEVIFELQKVQHPNIKGFEPKEFIVTLHAHDRVPEVEKIMKDYDRLYCLWNKEAYDIGVKKIQTKGVGIREFCKVLDIKQENTLGIGDNYNDKEMLEAVGISVTADKTRVKGDYFVPQEGEKLPAELLMDQILKVSR